VGYEATLAAFRRGDNAEAERLARADLDQATTSGDTAGRVDALCMLARTALRESRLAEVEQTAEAAYDAAGEDRWLQTMPIHLRAVAARLAGRHDEARALYLKSIHLNDAHGETVMAGAEHRNLAYVEISAGNPAEAQRLFQESRRRLQDADSAALAPYLTFDEASSAALDGDLDTARVRLASAEAQFAALGVVPDPDDAVEIDRLRQLVSE
jgi:tetratricopeptide (TPR) repeat protein